MEGLLGYAKAGVAFLFGPLADPAIGGHSFAISALPTIVFFAALISILYYLGIMQLVIRWIGGGLEWVTGISRVEALCAASNIFVGQSESPLVIRPYLAALSPSQMFCVMTVGMAGVAGTILAAYAAMGIRVDYLVAAAFMSAPGGVLMAKLIMPDVPPPEHAHDDTSLHNPHVAVSAPDEERPANLIMAASQGAQTGVRLAVAVGAMVLAFVALVAMANGLLGGIGGWLGYPGLSFQQILGAVFAPVFLPARRTEWLGRGDAGRRVVRLEDRAQRIRRLHRSGRGQDAECAHHCHRDVCAVRLRQLQLDCDPDGGFGQPRAEPAGSDCKAGNESAGGRGAIEPDERGAGGAVP